MKQETAKYIYSLVSRLAKFSRKQFSGDEFCADPAMMGMIFRHGADGQPRRIRMTDISCMLMISKPAATQMISRLVENGLAERIRDEKDRRVVYIQATEQGLELFDKQLCERLKLIERAVKKIGEEKAQQLGTLLDEFVDALIAEE